MKGGEKMSPEKKLREVDQPVAEVKADSPGLTLEEVLHMIETADTTTGVKKTILSVHPGLGTPIPRRGQR